MKSSRRFHYFRGSILWSLIGLALSFFLGWSERSELSAGLATMFLTSVLAVLEISLSFDNAVVNASVLRKMTPLWRHRFITWGILIAVFGMRLVFPLAVVSAVTGISPWSALLLAVERPDDYARVMKDSHLALAGFGGCFLLMVGLKYFFDSSKEIHWIRLLERPLSALGKVESSALGFSLLALLAISQTLNPLDKISFFVSGVVGLVSFIFLDGVNGALESRGRRSLNTAGAGLGLFIYLEILDASFSFDGVVGAFAITHNLFIIAIGLGIGALFVRSLTIMLVEEHTLAEYRFLEHGAFYAIVALAVMMLLDAVMEIPEVLTGLAGAILIGLSLWSSRRHQRKRAP